MPAPKQSKDLMKIGDLARRAGVSHRTIHYYERLGLLRPVEREGVGYRYFNEEAVTRLEKIAALKRLGLSLDEIASVIDLYFEDATGIRGKRRVLEILRGQLARTDQQILELKGFRAEVEENIARVEDLIRKARG
ncbi:MAG: MerR family transcriptional regulator [Pseudomonadota bacterium]